MSDIEKIRRETTIAGYVHPIENTSKNNTNRYKTFNAEKKGTDYVTAKNKSAYAKFTDNETIPKGCPDCGGQALYVCDCELKDKQCDKGHVWYIDKSGHIKKGDPHENE